MTLILLLEIASQGAWKQTQKPSSRYPNHSTQRQKTDEGWQLVSQNRASPNGVPAERLLAEASPGKAQEWGSRCRERRRLGWTQRAWAKSHSQSRLAWHPHSRGCSLPWSHYRYNQASDTPLAEWPTETNPGDTGYSKDCDKDKNGWFSKRLSVECEWFLGSGSALSIRRGVWPWVSCLMSLYLSFLIYKMTIIIDSKSQSWSQD